MLSKDYQVFYWIKKNHSEYLHHMFVRANNQKEAVQKCRNAVYEQTGRHAFKATTKVPESERYIDA